MKVAGLVKSSLIDYPGEIAAVVFTQGCNFRCGFCHNPDLIDLKLPETIPFSEVMEFLQRRAGLLDGVVITGGEPTLQNNLYDFIKNLKKLGYKVKLDTNGSNPKVLEKLLTEDLLDYVAMDIKTGLKSYEKVCGLSNTKVVQTSINLLKNSEIEYEFRTTFLPYYHSETDVREITEIVKGAKRFTMQGFRPEITLDKKLQSESSFTKEQMENFSEIIKPNVDKCVLHLNS